MSITDFFIERIGIYGEGIAKQDGLTVFVNGALPQETVRARITERKKTFARAESLDILKASPDRITPPCPYFHRCGGCQLMHWAYSKQLEAKRARVQDALERIGKIDHDVLPCIPSDSTFSYRNKIQLTVDPQGQIALFAHNSHTPIPITHCSIHCSLGEKVLPHLINLPSSLKQVVIRSALRTEQILVLLVTRDPEPPLELAHRLIEAVPEIRGVVHLINPSEDTHLTGTFQALAGQGSIEEELATMKFKISPASFFQVNPPQAENLYRAVCESAGLTGNETLLDAYCGVGTLSLIAAKQAKQVIGIEMIPDAVRDAEENAHRNQIGNASFLSGRAEEKLNELGDIDVALLNPPRIGCARSLLEALLQKRPQRILYVSCDPATLARDLQILIEGGYRLERVQPFDMFPQTMHVETLVSLIQDNAFLFVE